MSYICNLCPRKCNAERTQTDNFGGVCGMPYSLRIARASKHFWEEPCISGENGSGTVFFSGCQLKCSYCQNFDISHGKKGKDVTIQRLANIFRELQESGVHNINLVSATQFIPLIIEALKIYRPQTPIVFNSGGYESVETIELLKDYVDIFLLDFKYWSSEKAELYSAAKDYPEVAKAAIEKAFNIVGIPQYIDGILTKGVIVRHLLLPSATADCINIMNWIKESPIDVVFSLMSQYTVMPQNRIPALSRRVTEREYNKVLDKMMELELEGYIQDGSSSSLDFIPEFDFSGV